MGEGAGGTTSTLSKKHLILEEKAQLLLFLGVTYTCCPLKTQLTQTSD